MATLYKRANSKFWQIEYTTPDGKRIQKSSGTIDEKAAKEYAAKLEHDAWQQVKLNAKRVVLWQEAVMQWLSENQHKRSLHIDKQIFRWLHQHLHNVELAKIDREMIERIKQAKITDNAKIGTVNRTLALLRAVLNKAMNDWEFIDRVPKIRMMKTDKAAPRWLSHAEAMALIAELPSHLAEMARFALSTGLRESNITGLLWANVSIENKCCWINPQNAKGKRGIAVPLNDDAISCIRRQIGKHLTHVFTYQNRPVTRCNNSAWRKALKRCGLLGEFRFHDLRHTWASWHVQNGTPLHILMELGGWASLDMVQVYAHLSPAHLAEYASRSMPSVTISLTPKKNALPNER